MFAAARRVATKNSSKTSLVTAQTIWRQQHASSLALAGGEEVDVGQEKAAVSLTINTACVHGTLDVVCRVAAVGLSQPRESLADNTTIAFEPCAVAQQDDADVTLAARGRGQTAAQGAYGTPSDLARSGRLRHPA